MHGAVRAVGLALLALGLGACAPASGTAPAPRQAESSAPAAPGAAMPAVPGAATPAVAAPPPVERIRVSFAALTAIYAPHLIAQEKGYYTEEGIDMEIVRAGGGVATPALIAGEMQYSTSAATSLSAMLKGAPLKVIYTNADRALDDLWSSATGDPTLRGPDRARPVGMQSRGDTMEIAARLVLTEYGIDPDTVTITAMGVGSQRLVAAIETGTDCRRASCPSPTSRSSRRGPRGGTLADLRGEIQMLYTGSPRATRSYSSAATARSASCAPP